MKVLSCSRLLRATSGRYPIQRGSLQALLLCLPMLGQPLLAAPAVLTQDQTALRHFAETVQIRYQLLDNTPGPHCRAEQAAGACFTAELHLQSPTTFSRQDWRIRFSHVSPIQQTISDEFVITHLNGDLHELTPTSAFRGFAAGETKTLRFHSSFWLLSKAELMPNYYLVGADDQAYLLRSSQEQIDPETGLAILPFVSDLTDPNKHLKRTATDQSVPATANALYVQYQAWGGATAPAASDLLPRPKRLTERSGQLSLQRGLRIEHSAFPLPTLQAALTRLNQLGVAVTTTGVPVRLHQVPSLTLASEAYVLDISSERIDIVASDASGAFYALQSLAALLPNGAAAVPQLHIEDAPRYPFRGLHVDVGRNFHSKALLLKLLDQMAAYKLNKLHLHLADDEGWRLEIPGLPELTEIGGYRCHDPGETRCLLPQLGSGPERSSPVNGYYSVSDYVELVRAANARHIQVIPSLDMPGHARAAVRSMRARHDRLLAAGKPAEAARYLLDDPADQSRYESIQFYRDNTINVCMPSAYAFVDKIVAEVQKLHQQAGQALTRFHIGADETPGAWVASPICQQYLAAQRAQISDAKALGGHFIKQVGEMLRKRKVELAAWSDGVEHLSPRDLPGTVQANAWSVLAWNGHRVAHTLANQGWQVVISSPDVTYFDFPYAVDPEEGGYYWGTRVSSTRKVFEFMPDNLPAHAEFWPDRENKPYEADDQAKAADGQHAAYAPLRNGVRFHGLQAQIWSETIRSDAQVEYMLFPRLLALAERAWHQADWELPYRHDGFRYNRDSKQFDEARQAARQRDWQRFAGLLASREFAKLERQQIGYRLPTVGAVIRDGQLHANLPYRLDGAGEAAGLAIEYRQSSGDWQSYRGPVAITGAVQVRATSTDGQRKGRALQVAAP